MKHDFMNFKREFVFETVDFEPGDRVADRDLLERTRGAGAPEALGRETAEEEFRLRRNQPLNMAPSAPKDRYYQAEIFAQLFQKSRFFLGPGKCFTGRYFELFSGPFLGPLASHAYIRQ